MSLMVIAILGLAFLAINSHGAEDRPLIYLTYDDGPDPRFTPQLLDVLAKHKVKATFFMHGATITAHPELAGEVHQQGHYLANHNYTHARPYTFSPSEMKDAIERTDDLIRSISGQKTVLYRAPFLDITAEIKTYLCSTGRNSVSADMIGIDWDTQDPDQIIKNLLPDLAPDAVVLLHDAGVGADGTRMGTVKATDTLIPLLRSKGYEFADHSPSHRWQLTIEDCSDVQKAAG